MASGGWMHHASQHLLSQLTRVYASFCPLLLAATLPGANYPLSHSALAAPVILEQYGKAFIPIWIPAPSPPLTNATFNGWYFELGEHNSTAAYHFFFFPFLSLLCLPPFPNIIHITRRAYFTVEQPSYLTTFVSSLLRHVPTKHAVDICPASTRTPYRTGLETDCCCHHLHFRCCCCARRHSHSKEELQGSCGLCHPPLVHVPSRQLLLESCI